MNKEARYIVKENPLAIRYSAMRIMAPKAMGFLLGILIFYILREWVANLIGIIFPTSYFDIFKAYIDADTFNRLPSISLAQVLYSLLLGGVLTLGRTLYTLKFLREGETERALLLGGMSFYFRAALIDLISRFIIAAMTFLFLFPGIYFYYAYSQAMFVYADDPSKTALGALKESRLLMYGNKLSLFKLDLTYLALIFIGIMPTALLIFVSNIDPTTYSGFTLYCLSTLLFVVAMSHVCMGRALFYEMLMKGGLKAVVPDIDINIDRV